MPEWICDDGADADGGGGVCLEAVNLEALGVIQRSPVRHGITNFHNYAFGSPGGAGRRPPGVKQAACWWLDAMGMVHDGDL